MTKTEDRKSEKEQPIKSVYFVPGIGEIEAADLDDLEKKVKKLKEQEDGDGNI